ncbi:MAG: inositol monophosphatase [Planctomycetaceae bacterium]|nr:inositol monophosphatase [Planctomycetaceae bacterium]
MTELATAKQAAEAAATLLRKYFTEGVQFRQKDGEAEYNLVSQADVEAEQAIAEIIQETFPTHEILGEETNDGSIDAEHLWIVDPLDGTTNFAHRIPHFAVSIAYYRAGEAQCGVICNPIRNDWYVAEHRKGASHNGRPVQVATATQLSEVLVGVGFYYDRGTMMEATLAAVGDLFREQIHGIRRFGTASLDLAQVGCGLFGAFFEYELSPWDYAAGRLFVAEAAGKLTTCRGEPLPLSKTSLLASNGLLHPKMLAIVKSHHT